jgi:hypothetical protein
MLELDNPRWSQMRREGDYSTVIPAILRRLESPAHFMDERGAFDTLRLALIRCGEVDEVSYAAVPHLARLSASSGVPLWEFIGLIAEVEARRACDGAAPVPADLAPGYFQTVRELPRLIAACHPDGWREEVVGILAGALAVAFGQPRLGMAVMELGGELQHRQGKVECQACGEWYEPPGYTFG